VSGNINEFELSELCEADEIYVTAREKGCKNNIIRVRASADSEKGAETSRETNHQC